MLKIRLQRVGRKNIPVFRVVLTDKRNSTKSGKYLEVLGSFDMRDHKKQLVNIERVNHWVSNGAQLTETLHNFLVERKMIQGKKINVLPKKSPIKAEVKEAAPAAAPTLEAPAAEVK